MLRYFSRKSNVQESSSYEKRDIDQSAEKRSYETCVEKNSQESSDKLHIGLDVIDLPSDPGLILRIMDYKPNIREKIRREYYLRGPCQPRKNKFKTRDFNNKPRRFNPSWFDEFDWLEYSITKDAAFCLYCYLFKHECGEQGCGDTFVSEGFTNWKKKEKLREHVGGPNSAHNLALSKCRDLLNQAQHIENNFAKVTDEEKIDYKIRLESSIKCSRFLMNLGLPFRGHDESKDSSNRGLFVELLQFLADNNEEVRRVVLQNAPDNMKLTSPKIQKDIMRAATYETTKAIITN